MVSVSNVIPGSDGNLGNKVPVKNVLKAVEMVQWKNKWMKWSYIRFGENYCTFAYM